jgi:hypothetical protein
MNSKMQVNIDAVKKQLRTVVFSGSELVGIGKVFRMINLASYTFDKIYGQKKQDSSGADKPDGCFGGVDG